jgi:hypothetical protein
MRHLVHQASTSEPGLCVFGIVRWRVDLSTPRPAAVRSSPHLGLLRRLSSTVPVNANQPLFLLESGVLLESGGGGRSDLT